MMRRPRGRRVAKMAVIKIRRAICQRRQGDVVRRFAWVFLSGIASNLVGHVIGEHGGNQVRQQPSPRKPRLGGRPTCRDSQAISIA